MLRTQLMSSQFMARRNMFTWFKSQKIASGPFEEMLMKQNRKEPEGANFKSNAFAVGKPGYSWVDTADTKDLSHNFVAMSLFVTAYEKNKETMALMRTLVGMEHLRDINGEHVFGNKISFKDMVNSIVHKLFNEEAFTLAERFFYNEVLPGYRTVDPQATQRLLLLQKSGKSEDKHQRKFLVDQLCIYSNREQFIADEFNTSHQASAATCIEDLLKKKELFEAHFGGYGFHLTPQQCKMTPDQYCKDLETFKPAGGFMMLG
ncbi:MAG: hypothetical protein Q8R83_04210 [Legionellaceae bacterium]|nr:hypothetical protein [Legionellaceae bacterium]